MSGDKTLDEHYKVLTDLELLKLRAEGDLTSVAEIALDNELARRNLTSDEAKRYFAPKWLDKAEVGTVGVLALEGGERITAEVVGLNAQGDRLSVKVVSPNSLPQHGRGNHRAIPLDRIVSFEPQAHSIGRYPFSDPCRYGNFSLPRFILMTTIFLSLIVGSLPLFLLLTSWAYGLQLASMISYSLFIVFFTFARTGTRLGPDLPPYRFTCPAVQPQIPCLLWRHLGFLFALFVLQTGMLAVHTYLPDWWDMHDSKGGTPFEVALFLLCFGLGWTQVRKNRSLLDRAHRGLSA